MNVFLVHKYKLNPLQAKWPMEPVLISGFCSSKQMRVFESPWIGESIISNVGSIAGAQQVLILIYLP